MRVWMWGGNLVTGVNCGWASTGEYGAVRVLVGDHTGPAEYYNRASIFASAAYSTLDNYVFPLSGTDAYLTWNYNLKMLGSDIEVQALPSSG